MSVFHSTPNVGCVDELAGGNRSLHSVEDTDELLMAMLGHAALDHSSIKDIERCEQRRRAVALVIARHRPALARLDRQARLGASRACGCGSFR